jgi:hypothetical protein
MSATMGVEVFQKWITTEHYVQLFTEAYEQQMKTKKQTVQPNTVEETNHNNHTQPAMVPAPVPQSEHGKLTYPGENLKETAQIIRLRQQKRWVSSGSGSLPKL